MDRTRSRILIPLLALVVLAPYGPALLLGWPGTGFDYVFHSANVLDFKDALEEGIPYPRWAASANGGYGAPTFCFYPPLPYYLGAAGTLVTGDVDPGLLLIAALLSLLGSLSLFKLIRMDTGAAGAFAGAALFAWLPFTVLDLYHRFAWAEFCAIQILPVVSLFLRTFLVRPGPGPALGLVASLAALVASHGVTSLTFGPFLAAYVVYESLRRRSFRLLVTSAGLAVLAAGITAAFLGPVLLDQHLVHLDHITTSRHGQYGRNFLFHDAVAQGFTPSPFKARVALSAAAQTLLLLGAGGILLLRRRLNGLFAFLILAALFHLYMTTALSEPLWRILPWLGTIQFPWRVCGAYGFLTAWIFGVALDTLLRVRRGRMPGLLLAGVPAAAVLVLAGYEIHASYQVTWGDRGDPRTRLRQRSFVIREYVPRDVAIGNLLKYVQYDPERRLVEARGEAEVRTLQWTPHRRRLEVEAGADGAVLVLPVFNYPGWILRVDDRVTDITANNPLCLIEVPVPAGKHRLELRHEATASRIMGSILSLAALLAALLTCLRFRGVPPPPPGRPFASVRWKWTLAGATLVLSGLWIPFPFPRPVPHIVVLTASGLRADHAHFNGYLRPTTENLDFLALGEGIRFRRAYTPVPDAARAAEALWVTSGLAEDLRRSGYRIGAVLGEDLLIRRPALKAAFPDATVPGRHRMPGAEVVARASLFMRQNTGTPLCLWIHLADAAGPYTPGPERRFRSPPGPGVALERIPAEMRVRVGGRVLRDLAAYRDLYDEALVGVDRFMGRFVNDLHHPLNLYDRTFLAVAGLCGADLGDGPTPFKTGGSLHEVQTAVYLLVKFPGNRYMGQAVETPPVSVVQLASTLEEILHPERRPARSLCRLLEGNPAGAEVSVRLPGTSIRERVFEKFKVRWGEDGQPEVLRWIPEPPWETPWTGETPEEARAILSGKGR